MGDRRMAAGRTRSHLTQAKDRTKRHDRDCPRLVGIWGTPIGGENVTPPLGKGRPIQRKKVRAMDDATTRLTVDTEVPGYWRVTLSHPPINTVEVPASGGMQERAGSSADCRR